MRLTYCFDGDGDARARQWFEFPQANVTLTEAERVQQKAHQNPLL